jgi:hypothetical protein
MEERRAEAREHGGSAKIKGKTKGDVNKSGPSDKRRGREVIS